MKIIKLNMHNSKKQVTICPDIRWKTLVKVYIYLHYIVDSDLNATFLKTLINWKNYSSLFYKWRCWCVCGLMYQSGLRRGTLSARISQIHLSAERLIASPVLYFTLDSRVSAQTFSTEPSWHFHLSAMLSGAVQLKFHDHWPLHMKGKITRAEVLLINTGVNV